MRELRFRVWSEDEKRFNAYDYAFTTMKEAILEVHPNYDGVAIEQYTGLKDKNGKEIYEGDIARVVRSYGYGFLPKGAKAKIEFDEKELCYKLRGQGEFRLTAKKELEVIGNIHENYELLEEE